MAYICNPVDTIDERGRTKVDVIVRDGEHHIVLWSEDGRNYMPLELSVEEAGSLIEALTYGVAEARGNLCR